MPDFESGAFNRALPPLRYVSLILRDLPIVAFCRYALFPKVIARQCVDPVCGVVSISVEHTYRFEGVRGQIFADKAQFVDQIGRHSNDVATCILRLKNVKELPRTCPEELRQRPAVQYLSRLFHHRDWIDAGIGNAARKNRDDGRRQ
jgi:hypothetical protein